MSLRTIRLELAREPGFPEGSDEHGYEFVAPLTPDGHVDEAAWRVNRDACTVRRFWRGEDDLYGHLVRQRGRWLFHYEEELDEDDESIFRFDQHLFREGEYVSITEHDGQQHTFKVASVKVARGR